MSTPQPVDIFATPENREALVSYIKRFSTKSEKEAALLGFNNFNSTSLGIRVDKLEPAERIVALTVAGMRWNLYCKEVNSVSQEHYK